MKNYNDNIDDQVFPHFMRDYDDNVNDAKLSRDVTGTFSITDSINNY